MNLMTTSHPAWSTFFGKLVMELDFTKTADGGVTNKCNGTLEKSKRVLYQMGGFNVPETLEYFVDCGGNCDCEVVFNVAGNRDWIRHEDIRK